jgi:hypothetical protein
MGQRNKGAGAFSISNVTSWHLHNEQNNIRRMLKEMRDFMA